MSKLAFSALLIAGLCMVGCGGGDDDGVIIAIPDGGTNGGTDGGNTSTTCNPVNQQGCADGQKCAPLVVSSPSDENPTAPLIVNTTCVPDGSKNGGEACENGPAGPETGYDDCKAGLDCFLGACAQICSSQLGGNCAAADDSCSVFGNLYQEFEDVGICTPSCSLDLQDCDGEGNGCYLGNQGVRLCLPGGEPTHGQPCETDNNGNCFINGCAKGTDANGWQGGTLTMQDVRDPAFMFVFPDACIAYCTTSSDPEVNIAGGDGEAGTSCDEAGATGAECRFMNGWLGYIDSDDPTWIPDSVGVCADPLQWESCADADINGINDENLTGFVFGCWSGTDILAAIDEAPAAAPKTDAAKKLGTLSKERKELIRNALRAQGAL